MKTRTLFGVILTLAFVAAGSFLWGYLAHRNEVFPYRIARRVAIAAGMITPQPQPNFDIFSRPFGDAHALETLGYVEGSTDDRPDLAGVVAVDAERVFPAPRLYSSVETGAAFLISIEGEVLHRWAHDTVNDWQYSHMLPDGDLIVIDREDSILRLDRSSELQWSVALRAHHDLDVWNDRIFVLTRKTCDVEEINPTTPVSVDFVSTFTLDGEPVGELSLLDAIMTSDYAYLVPSVADLSFDPEADERDRPLCLLHANHVEIVDLAEEWLADSSGKPLLLVTLRNINSVAAMDLEGKDIAWLWGPNTLIFPHDGSVLENGYLSVFNNGIEQSEVLELDPDSFEVVWRYRAPGFFTATRGGVQRLANGNTLITESNAGRVFELAPNGDLVWEWLNPAFTDDGKRRALFRMTALEETPQWLQ